MIEKFSTVEDGLGLLRSDYTLNSEVVNGEYADSLVNDFDEYFSEGQDKFIAMQSIQAFRSIDDGFEEEEGYLEVESETQLALDSIDDDTLHNEFQEYEFALCPGRYIPSGVRVGFEIENDEGDIEFRLDDGIVYSNTPKTFYKEDIKRETFRWIVDAFIHNSEINDCLEKSIEDEDRVVALVNIYSPNSMKFKKELHRYWLEQLLTYPENISEEEKGNILTELDEIMAFISSLEEEYVLQAIFYYEV